MSESDVVSRVLSELRRGRFRLESEKKTQADIADALKVPEGIVDPLAERAPQQVDMSRIQRMAEMYLKSKPVDGAVRPVAPARPDVQSLRMGQQMGLL